ncbi:ABC transporter substrate-binding protein [Chthonobacter albigriseus]|uniref:ABC transporter substrate-binding protein n=1 Tax=Chthonobacter albigriseus TaxID=1683161 RepID=UPI0015EEBFF5|nr:ABC transporter substrate-binding protein [Chthonobacter albigriseus]
MRRFFASAALAAVIAATVSALPAQAEDKIRALAPTWVGFAPALVANTLGYYAEEGLEVDFKFEDDRSNVLAAYARGDIEVDMRTVGEHQGRPRDASTPGIIIGTIDLSVGGDGVVADGSIASVADLKGKTVAVEPNIPARLLLQMELAKAGLSLKDVDLKEIATADTLAVFADESVAAVGTYEPFMSQSVKAITNRNPKILVSSKDAPGLIIDIITARQDDLAANPEKYRKFLRGIYRAVDFYKKDPAKFAELAAPFYGLTPAEVTEIIDTSLGYTTYEDAVAYLGTKEQPGTLHGFFDQVMQLNLDYGAADVKLDAAQQIDPSVLTGLFDGAKR